MVYNIMQIAITDIDIQQGKISDSKFKSTNNKKYYK